MVARNRIQPGVAAKQHQSTPLDIRIVSTTSVMVSHASGVSSGVYPGGSDFD